MELVEEMKTWKGRGKVRSQRVREMQIGKDTKKYGVRFSKNLG